ncbi:facilitated trehalose transporter Tret1-like, partial [Asbolus verrucosus]
SLGAITNPIGSILSGLLADYFGRKRSIQLSSIPFLIGWMCIGLAHNIDLLYTGRLISGIAAGMSTACYTYVSEISTPENRGIFQALGPICASFGILLTYILGYFIKWSTVAFISTSFALFTLIAVEFLPESPDYLTKSGDSSKSFDSYLWFRRNVLLAQQESQKNTAMEKINQKSIKEAYLSSTTVKPFLILVTLFFLQELSGIYTILFYAINFFEETGLNLNNYVSSIIVGFIRFAMSITTAFLINRFGRKILCMISSGGMSLTMLAMVVFFKYYEIHPDESRIFPLFPLVCVIFNVMFSMVGMLPIPWILVGELFPLQVRSIIGGVVICIAQCFIFICVKIYPDMIAHLQFSGTLGTFLVAAIGALVFCKFLLPETKNKSLQEIEDYFRDGPAIDASLEGYDNKGFVLRPEMLNKSEEIFTVQVH